MQIIISQRATIGSEVKAADALFAHYSTARDIAATSTEEIAELIRPAGLQLTKAKNIKTVCSYILHEFEDDFERMLAALNDDDARALLLTLPGVGPKTADCLLELGLGRLVLPIETNIRRVGKRLRLITDGDSDEMLQKILTAQIGRSNQDFIDSHSLLMAIGQRLCRSGAPHCTTCLVCTYLDRE